MRATKRKRITSVIPTYSLPVDIRIKRAKQELENLRRQELINERSIDVTKIDNELKWMAIQQETAWTLNKLK